MARTIRDDELRVWEGYADTGRYGYPESARVVFRCLTDARERARAYTVHGDKSDAEALVATAPVERLHELLQSAQPLD